MSAVATVRPSSRPFGLVGTGVIHGALVALLVLYARRAPEPSPIVYAVDLVAAPAPTEAPRRAAQEATPVAEAETAPILPPKQVKPEPVKPKPANQVKVEDKAPITKSQETPIATATPSTGRDVVTLSQAGMQFPYPDYLRKITNEIYRRWQQPLLRTNLNVEVSFVILRDGSVDQLNFVSRSGREDFDLNAMGAVEAAGRAKAFGPLPSGFVGDQLPISFYFAPGRRQQ